MCLGFQGESPKPKTNFDIGDRVIAKCIIQVLPSEPNLGVLFVTLSGVNRDLHLGDQFCSRMEEACR